jgi:Ca2+-binding RTX toxin-like protein
LFLLPTNQGYGEMKRAVVLFTVVAVVGVSMLVVLLRLGGPAPGQQSDDPVLVGAGDIAKCNDLRDEATADLLDDIPGTVYTTGDNAYDSGTSAEFQNCYQPSWGRHKARTHPTPGNHEYFTAGASGYFGYFGSAAGDPTKGYYSYDLDEWHIVSLNSQCGQVGGCGSASPMVTWLKQDLAANPAACTAAYWHHPVFSSGAEHGNDPKMKPSWQALYDADADVILAGHSHNYERFSPQDANGVADPQLGIREFVVGTGGPTVHGFGTIQPNSEVRNAGTSGVLKLTLHPTSYDWEFVPVAGKTFTDTGSGQCHGLPPAPDTTAPTVSGVAPADGASNVALGANAVAGFSEAMNSSTTNNTTFTLSKPDATLVAATVSYNTTTNETTLNPTEALQPGTTYTATLKGGTDGVKDLAGNPMAADRVWSFTTTTQVACTRTGTSSADTLTGTSGDDVICGGGAPDTIMGLEGNDVLKGEGGGDKLYGGPGEDTLDGGIGTDTADFSGASVAVSASLVDNTATGEGSDTLVSTENLVGSNLNDTLAGSATINSLSGGNGVDMLWGQDGADKLTGGGGNDTLHGEAGSDSVVGSGGADNLFGEDDDDTLNSKDNVSGNDRLDGGAGTDACTTDVTEASIISCP